jgi:hypothetical protein
MTDVPAVTDKAMNGSVISLVLLVTNNIERGSHDHGYRISRK